MIRIVAIYKFDGSDWNQLGQSIHGTVADERHTEECRLSADGTRLLASQEYHA